MVDCEECEDAPATQTREDEDGNTIDLCDDCAEDWDEEHEEGEEEFYGDDD